LWSYIDITEKNKILTAIAENEAKSKLIMNSALDAIITIDEMGCVLLWNPQAEKIFGWKEAEVIGKLISEVIIPERLRASHEKGMAHYRATSEGPVLQKIIELPAMHKNGSEFPVELSIAPIFHGNKVFFCSFIRDISERKRSELALATSEQKYRSIIANMNLGLLEVDEEDRIQFCNQSFTDISGYALDDILGKKASAIFASEKGQQVISEKNEQRKSGKSDSFELEIINKKGENKWWLISGAPNYNDSGEIIGSIGIHLDITKQKRLEQQLGAALIKAQIASEAKQTFIANMSHEIRTPLNAIIGMVRELGREKLTKTQNIYVENSEKAAKHLLSMVNNILDISKIEAGEIVFENSEFSLVALVEMVENILEIQAQEKGLQCICNLAPDIKPVLIGDSSRIRQVLINLIGNAIKFTDKGMVKLEVKVINSIDNKQKLNFKIEDTGRGMSPEFLKTIFDKFSREQLVNSKKIEGTGLGMPITNELINLMGGSLNVKSTLGKGTIVEFELELRVGDSSNILGPSDTITQNNLSGLHCLLVEDNEMNRLIAGKSLKFFGCNVTEAGDGAEAIELLKKNTYQFVLMDIQMPVMDGLEATKYIRKQLKLSIPIIALTANAFKSDIDAYLAIGMNSYVNKPYEEQALYHVITEVLGPHILEKLERKGSEDALDYDLSKIIEISRGDKSFVAKMINLFVSQLSAFLPELKQAQLNSEFLKIGKIAHQLKPGIETMQIKHLIPLVLIMEREGLAEQPDVKLLFQTMNEFEAISLKNIQALSLEIEN
jgi:PAS domain S-box-containing protein